MRPTHIHVAALALALLLLAAGIAPAQIYVDGSATVPGSGTSWSDPMIEVADALASLGGAPSFGTEVWVRAGTYRPDHGTLDRAFSFMIPDGVRVYGGFAGGELSLAERDPAANVTVLSGDLLSNDGPGFAGRADNAYHVVVFLPGSFGSGLDGFRIRGGNANASPTDPGGGILVLGAAAEIVDCELLGNRADGHGGAIFADAYAAVTLRGCQLRNNRSVQNGGAVHLETTGVIEDSLFASNIASANGGGLSISGFGPAPSAIDRCTFRDNQATAGGATYQYDTCSRFTNCRFRNNVAVIDGGAIYLGNTDVAIVGCFLSQNAAGFSGGAVYDNNVGGGRMIINSSFYGNTATAAGGVYGYGGSISLLNSILWGNTDGGVVLVDAQYSGTAAYTLDHCCVMGYVGTATVLPFDPEFVDPVVGNLHLRRWSPCRNAGDATYVTAYVTVDLDGDPRVLEGMADIGADEVFRPWPGTGGDLAMTVTHDGAAVTAGFAPVAAGEAVAVRFFSLAGTTVGSLGLAAFELHGTGALPPGPAPGIHFGPSALLVPDPVATPLLLPAGGHVIPFTMPAGLAGYRLLIQSIAAGALLPPPYYASSDAVDLELL